MSEKPKPVEKYSCPDPDGCKAVKDTANMQNIIDRLEEKLTEANEEIGRLRDVFGTDKPWSLLSCLDTLADAADILLHDKSYDQHGYEAIGHAVDASRKHIEKLRKVKAEQALKGD